MSALNSTSHSISLKWNPPPYDKQNGVIISYVINVTNAVTLVSVQYYTATTSIIISNLEPFTTYVCVVAAATSVGVGPFSHLLFVQTDEGGKSIK